MKAQLEACFTERSICHSDIWPENFLLDQDKRVWLIDFQHIGVLPAVFQTYAFFNIGQKFASDVGKRLGYQPSDTANTIARASGTLQMCGGDANLGNYSSSLMATSG